MVFILDEFCDESQCSRHSLLMCKVLWKAEPGPLVYYRAVRNPTFGTGFRDETEMTMMKEKHEA